MQTAKIEIGGEYAYQRSGLWVRFRVEAINTHKNARGTVNTIKGYVVEDRKDGKVPTSFPVDPKDLDGPYEAKSELVERKAKEDQARKEREDAEKKQALQDRRDLYRFCGIEPPKDPGSYEQAFRVPSYARNVEVTDKLGVAALLAAIRKLHEHLRPVA